MATSRITQEEKWEDLLPLFPIYSAIEMASGNILDRGDVAEQAAVRFSRKFIQEAGKDLPALTALKKVQGMGVTYPEEEFESDMDIVYVIVKGQKWCSGMTLNGKILRNYFHAHHSDRDRRVPRLRTQHPDI